MLQYMQDRGESSIDENEHVSALESFRPFATTWNQVGRHVTVPIGIF